MEKLDENRSHYQRSQQSSSRTMSQVSHSDDVLEIGRALGWDFAFYGLKPWNPELPGVAEGYADGQMRQSSHKPDTDRFVRKHLQLRTNALRRGKVVDASLTVKLLEEIDYDMCPVTLTTLTHGEKLDSDWSIDRINNNGAYAENNVVVLSTRANEAKGNKSFDEVFKLANGIETVEGLTPREWLRMTSIMFGPCATENPALKSKLPLPLATRISNYSFRPEYFQLQRLVLKAAKQSSDKTYVLRQMKKIHPGGADRLDLVVHKVAQNLRHCEYEYDSLVDDAIQARLYAWLQSMSWAQHDLFVPVLTQLLGGESLKVEMVERCSFKTKGKMV